MLNTFFTPIRSAIRQWLKPLVMVVVGGGFLLAVASCTRRAPRLAHTQEMNLIAAKYADIPVPLGFSVVHAQDAVGGVAELSFSGKATRATVQQFYRVNLEAAGWSVADFSTNREGLFVATKPRATAIISLREQGKVVDKPRVLVVVAVQRGLLVRQNSLAEKNDINSKELPFG